MLVESMKSGASLPERRVTDPESVPSLQELAKVGAGRKQKSAGV
jgi:hypothetical protein